MMTAQPHDEPAKVLLGWYDRHARRLPWRSPPGFLADPYVVWLSEIMLQQTTVAAVIPYFYKFLEAWPTADALAQARDEDVMRAWAGLGYYARARNLLATARIVTAGGGAFPATEAGLRTLPGVGSYTAAAVAAIAFGQRAVVVDGNVERVITRLMAIRTPLPKAKKEIWAAADALTPKDRPGDFAQAMMDLGATLCTVTRPACSLCPLAAFCGAKKFGNPETYPYKKPKVMRPERFGHIFVALRADHAVLAETRPPRGLLGGMTAFPGSSWVEIRDDEAALLAAPLPLNWRRADGEVKHVFTHFSLHLCVHTGHAPLDTPPPPGMRWVNDFDVQALPSVMRKVAVKAGLTD